MATQGSTRSWTIVRQGGGQRKAWRTQEVWGAGGVGSKRVWRSQGRTQGSPLLFSCVSHLSVGAMLTLLAAYIALFRPFSLSPLPPLPQVWERGRHGYWLCCMIVGGRASQGLTPSSPRVQGPTPACLAAKSASGRGNPPWLPTLPADPARIPMFLPALSTLTPTNPVHGFVFPSPTGVGEGAAKRATMSNTLGGEGTTSLDVTRARA